MNDLTVAESANADAIRFPARFMFLKDAPHGSVTLLAVISFRHIVRP